MELRILMQALLSKWRIILPIFGITFFAAWMFTRMQPSIYEAKATHILNLSESFNDQREIATVLDIISRRVEIATTFVEVATSRRIKILAAQELGLPPEIRNRLSVSSRLIAGTNIIEISVQGTDPILVRDFTNAIGSSTVTYIHNLYEIYHLEPLDNAVTPQTPIRPRATLNLILGGLFGLVLGAGFAFISNYLQTEQGDSRIRSGLDEDLKDSQLDYLTMMQLRQDLTTLHAKMNMTNEQLQQIQHTLTSTKRKAEEMNYTIGNQEKLPEDNHNNNQ